MLEEAYEALARIPGIIDGDTHGLGSMDDSAEIMSDMGLSDSEGGWSYLGGEVSDVTNAVKIHVGNLRTKAAEVHAAMRSTIDTLHGTDKANEQAANQQNSSTSTAPVPPNVGG
ncbi:MULTISPECIES: hypothetical protein [unclassified Nocardioides]|uniref:hypothetical protein n=1 Tax=unclassified Nocardioides TaxID=2615069 RepID=UPI0006F59E56|nr:MULTISPECIES: hypothetical protein [unclassified Nocardioides]KQY56336.1 hypothetical protein ASD30_08285 [Nocardioides sp. Root140]KQZ75120.1 hypothetical protein ASD66_01750 [Nocardioides sp. Root151]KRF14198.1 hypothetical protein ASH02_07545 [Nocardioides sp. Soil796]